MRNPRHGQLSRNTDLSTKVELLYEICNYADTDCSFKEISLVKSCYSEQGHDTMWRLAFTFSVCSSSVQVSNFSYAGFFPNKLAKLPYEGAATKDNLVSMPRSASSSLPSE